EYTSDTISIILCISLLAHYSFFFFQAEDGIRDRNVTGVQTCTLPISQQQHADAAEDAGRIAIRQPAPDRRHERNHQRPRRHEERSEERRVGKECRTGGWTEQ